jgi:hypothetical protein
MEVTMAASNLEALFDDRRFRVVGGIAAALMLLVSGGLIVAAKSPSKFRAMKATLPEKTLNIEILKSLPEPMEMKGSNGAVAVSSPSKASVSMRGRLMARR